MVSNQYLIDLPTTPISSPISITPTKLMTGSAGASYRWNGALLTTDLIYGSGLRAGDLESTPPVPPISEHNDPLRGRELRLGARFQTVARFRAADLRFAIVNLFDKIYEFAPAAASAIRAAIGARRGFLCGSFTEI